MLLNSMQKGSFPLKSLNTPKFTGLTETFCEAEQLERGATESGENSLNMHL